ncbi:MAG: PQQ-binding-like beta-propeller repeat protein [Deltaproteobacteria bacterium]|nr:PQQ-binding-like beta-propeller repeat protein [Deltaproteobacteria bacterium]
MEAFDYKKTAWYKKRTSAQDNGFLKKSPRKFWIFILALFLAFFSYLFLTSPFTPDLRLLFYQPSSRIETGTRPGEWTTYARTPDHQRFLDRNVSFKGEVRWSLAQSELVDSSPVVVEGVLYVGDHFKVMALNVSDGKVLWTYPTTGPVNSSPAVAGDLLFLGLLDGRVLGLNRHSGKLQWEFKTGNFIIGSPTVVDGLLYIGSADRYLYALDARLGTLAWKEPAAGKMIQAPAVRDTIVYAASDANKLYSLSGRTGARRLEFFLTGTMIDSPVVSPTIVYAVTLDGRLIALKHKARQYPWSHGLKIAWIQLWMLGFPVPTPSLQPGTLWGIFPKERKGKFVSSPAVADDRLFVGDNRGRFYALDAHKGTFLWELELGEGVATAPLVLGDTVYFGTKTGILYGVSRRDGSLQWKFPLGSPIKGDLVYAADRLLVRTSDGTLQAIE